MPGGTDTQELRRWNEQGKRYLPHFVPDYWNLAYKQIDWDEVVNCCQCGHELHFDECYQSMQILDNDGLGYGICEQCCFEIEWPERIAAGR